MNPIQQALLALDPAIILLYRVPGPAWLDFLVGTTLLSLVCCVLGDALRFAVARINRRHYGRLLMKLAKGHGLSVEAAKLGDNENFRAANITAHEAFGKYFFAQAALFCVSITPVPFALAWMDLRFRQVDFLLPLVDHVVRYPFFFLPIYILTRLIYSRLTDRMPAYQKLMLSTLHLPEDAAPTGR